METINPRAFLANNAGQIPDGRDMTEEDYHRHPAISNSDLGLLAKHPKVFMEKKAGAVEEGEPPQHFKMGTMIEQQLLQPSRFRENFLHVPSDVYEPRSGTKMGDFAEALIDEDTSPLEAYEEAGYKMYDDESTNEKKALKKAQKVEEWIEIQRELREGNKRSFDSDERATLLKVSADLSNHDRASKLLLQDQKWEKAWSQLPVFGHRKGILIKGLVDRVVYDGEHLFSIDLKTSSKSLNSFDYWYCQYRYYRQQAMYQILLRKWMEKHSEDQVPGITTIVVAVSTREPYDTRVFRVPESILDRGREEINELLDLLSWHIGEDKWERPKSYFEDGDPVLEYEESNINPLKI